LYAKLKRLEKRLPVKRHDSQWIYCGLIAKLSQFFGSCPRQRRALLFYFAQYRGTLFSRSCGNHEAQRIFISAIRAFSEIIGRSGQSVAIN
jgi:hypothetical protein